MKRQQTEKMLSSKTPNSRFTSDFDEFYFPQTFSPLDSDFPQLWIHGNISCFSKSTRRETCILLTPHLQTKKFMEFRVQDPVRDFRFSICLSFIEPQKIMEKVFFEIMEVQQSREIKFNYNRKYIKKSKKTSKGNFGWNFIFLFYSIYLWIGILLVSNTKYLYLNTKR